MTDIALLASRAGLILLAPEDIADLPADERVVYLARLRAFCLDHDMRDYGPYVEWVRYADRCSYINPQTDEQCVRTRYDDHRTCLNHLDLSEIDPSFLVKQKADVARLRMADLLQSGVDRLEEIITADPDEISPNVRLTAISTLFDRAGLPKQSSSNIEARVEVSDGSQYHDIISERLDRLASSTVTRELEGIVEAEVVDDEDLDDFS